MSESLKPGLKKAPVQDIFDLEMRIYVSYQHSQLITADPALNPLVDQHFVHWNWQFGWHTLWPYFQPQPRSRIHISSAQNVICDLRSSGSEIFWSKMQDLNYVFLQKRVAWWLHWWNACWGPVGMGWVNYFSVFPLWVFMYSTSCTFPLSIDFVCLNDHGHCTYFHCLPLCD